MFGEFQQIGRDLFLAGLVNSHSGNMSVRQGNRIIITRTGSQIGHLLPSDLITTGIEPGEAGDRIASCELVVHRAIYQACQEARAIIHAHIPFGIVLSMITGDDYIVPLDEEGKYYYRKGVPVVRITNGVSNPDVAAAVSKYLKEYSIVIAQGHGSFARGRTLEEAYKLTTAFASSAKIAYHVRLAEAVGMIPRS